MMLYRICLAILHYNENADRPQARTQAEGKLQWKVVYPKSKKGQEAVVKPVKEKVTYGEFTASLVQLDVLRYDYVGPALYFLNKIRPCKFQQMYISGL